MIIKQIYFDIKYYFTISAIILLFNFNEERALWRAGRAIGRRSY